jgi:large conductance mechanosensitive channel
MKKGKEVLKEFKDFATKGDIITMAIGIMIGTAFKSLIDSLVNDIISPPIGFLTSGIDFSSMFFTLGKIQYETIEEAQEAGATIITYGNFINTLISFLITAIVLFIFVSQMKKLFVRDQKETKKTTRKCPYCFTDINIKATRCPNCTSKLPEAEKK